MNLNQNTKKRSFLGLGIIVVVYIAVASYTTLNLPLYEASDELWHYPMVKYLADNGLALPPQDPQNPGPWRQEGSQPPLYYMLGAVLTTGIDTSDIDSIRRLNPHSDIGVIHPDGNANIIIHNWQREVFPWTGTVLATYLVRLFSILLGACTVVVTFFTARMIFPESLTVALAATGVQAFLPMFVFISSSVNNDNLSNLMGNLLVLVLLWTLKQSTLSWRHYITIGIVTGIGILSKLNIGFLIPIVALVLLWASIRERHWRTLVYGGIVSGGLTIFIAGWWYWRNFQLYGDPTGLDRFLDMVGRRPVPADLAQVWLERDSFTRAFWGFFGGMNVTMPESIYTALNIFGGIGLLSAVSFIAWQIIQQKWTKQRWFLTGLTILWSVITLISYTQWTSLTIAAQGRLVFGALSSIILWMVWGYLWWLPIRLRPLVGTVMVLGFFGLAVYVPQGVIAPAYALPQTTEVNTQNPDARFGINEEPQLSIHDVALETTNAIRAGDYVIFDMTIVANKAMERNWSLFIHLLSPDDVIIGQRDVYPGQGSIATSELEVGRQWRNRIAVLVPPNAYTPMTVDVVMGWYDHTSGERMRRTDIDSDTLTIGQVTIEATSNSDGIPNPISIHFEDVAELIGYTLTDLSPEQGQNIELTLYWRAQQSVETDWVVFANIIDPISLTKYAESNAMPANWTRPTSTWLTNEIIKDTHQLTVRQDAQPGIYEIEVGMYTQTEDGNFIRLKAIETNNTFVHLTRVRILPKEDGTP